MPAALRTDWLSPAQFEAMLDEEEWPDGEADREKRQRAPGGGRV
jgi:hypothetical protein